jgi:hypothetical protein
MGKYQVDADLLFYLSDIGRIRQVSSRARCYGVVNPGVEFLLQILSHRLVTVIAWGYQIPPFPRIRPEVIKLTSD